MLNTAWEMSFSFRTNAAANLYCCQTSWVFSECRFSLIMQKQKPPSSFERNTMQARDVLGRPKHRIWDVCVNIAYPLTSPPPHPLLAGKTPPAKQSDIPNIRS